ncbi:hypothetical protein VNO77_28497 [Canavalia gladiata]|uniref:BHLH domain-containing protein n=1 Tax=Canavalia gladiata TaxID=3824 RepID=A0AAN9Q783_CANGL
MDQKQPSQPSSSTKIERKIVEKNRRNQMKNLYSTLYSVLPNHNSKDAKAVPDQIDEAIDYIKNLETKVKREKEKRESLKERKKTRGDCSSAFQVQGNPKSPKIEIQETDSSLEVILTCGADNEFLFYEIIRILFEENVEIVTANFSIVGDSLLLVVHGEIPQSCLQFGASKVSERLKRFVNGSTSDMETESALWDYEIGTPEMWGFIDPTLNMGLPNPL